MIEETDVVTITDCPVCGSACSIDEANIYLETLEDLRKLRRQIDVEGMEHAIQLAEAQHELNALRMVNDSHDLERCEANKALAEAQAALATAISAKNSAEWRSSNQSQAIMQACRELPSGMAETVFEKYNEIMRKYRGEI